MTALTADRKTPQYGLGQHPEKRVVPVAASTKIYAGSLVALNASGYAIPTSADSAFKILGVAEAQADNSSGSAGAINVTVLRGCFGFVNSSSTDALSSVDIGALCYAVDDQTLARTSSRGVRPIVGRVQAIENPLVFVEIGHEFQLNGAVDLLLLAGADLSSKQFYCMTLQSDGTVNTTGTAGGEVLGILQNTPASGAVAIVRVFGMSKIIASTTIATGVRVASTNAGKTKAAVAATTNTSDAGAASDPLVGSYTIGIAVTDGATDTAHNVFVNTIGAIPSTAA